MEIFEFTVNESFLEDSGHPITIPPSQLPYQQLESVGLNHKHVTVVLPQEERFQAEICRREAAYQLRFNGNNCSLPSYLKLNDHLLVMLVKTAVQSYAVIEYRG